MTRLNTSTKGKPKAAKAAKSIASIQSLSAFVKSICDVMRRSNCASALQYVPELTWILFLRILDAQDGRDRERAEALGTDFSPALASPYRWQDWAAPPPKTEAALEDHPRTPEGKPFGWKRQELFALGDGRLIAFINKALLLKMGEKNSDGGQFFTPREVIRAMVHTVAPSLGQTVYDPCCGTGGFLAIAYEHIARKLGEQAASTDLDRLKHDTFFGREKENLVFPIALANLVLHGIDQPNLWHGNALTRQATYGALYEQAPRQFDVILTNPPFGGKEGTDAQKNFSFRTGATQVLFVQDILAELAPGGTCGIVLDEGFLFRTNESAFVETKRKLVDECDLWAIVSLPGGVFSTAGAGVKTNLVFFTKGRKTERIWYYDLSQVKVGKKQPMTLAHFGFGQDGEVLADAALPANLSATLPGDRPADAASADQLFPSYARLLPKRGTEAADSPHSWTCDFAARRAEAREAMQPLTDKAADIRAEVSELKQSLALLKKQRADEDRIKTAKAKIRDRERAARELDARAAAIDAAVFDLKAVNPNAIAEPDQRTSA